LTRGGAVAVRARAGTAKNLWHMITSAHIDLTPRRAQLRGGAPVELSSGRGASVELSSGHAMGAGGIGAGVWVRGFKRVQNSFFVLVQPKGGVSGMVQNPLPLGRGFGPSLPPRRGPGSGWGWAEWVRWPRAWAS
jgi:hypothetical protein